MLAKSLYVVSKDVTNLSEHRPATSYTCTLPEHQAAEKQYREKEKATFQLKKRFEEQQERQNPSANPSWDDDDEMNTGSEAVVEAAGGAKKKSETVRAHFGRGRMHNEQLIIAPCGMILARETFYFSEAFSAIAVSRHQICEYHPIHLSL